MQITGNAAQNKSKFGRRHGFNTQQIAERMGISPNTVKEMELYQALEWLAWGRNRSVSHNFGRWIKEPARILRDHPTVGSKI
jgi:hypothetical protein